MEVGDCKIELDGHQVLHTAPPLGLNSTHHVAPELARKYQQMVGPPAVKQYSSNPLRGSQTELLGTVGNPLTNATKLIMQPDVRCFIALTLRIADDHLGT